MCMLPTLSFTPKDHEHPVNGCVPMSNTEQTQLLSKGEEVKLSI